MTKNDPNLTTMMAFFLGLLIVVAVVLVSTKPIPVTAPQLTAADIRWIHAKRIEEVEKDKREKEWTRKFNEAVKAGRIPQMPGVGK